MFSVNSSLDESSMIRVPNLYKKLGISNKIALKPQKHAEVYFKVKRPSKRQTMFASELPDIFTSFHLFNSFKLEPKKHSSTCTEDELFHYTKDRLPRQMTQKSKFISNWIQNMKKNKENSEY